MSRVAVLTFPGSNCDDDCAHVAGAVLGHEVVRVWHKEASLPDGLDGVIIPGGFSYGDYLRSGAIARFAPIMSSVAQFAQSGGPVLGICNGFQILLECGLLEGAMLHNIGGRFICRDVWLDVARDDTRFTAGAPMDAPIRVPVAHAEGNWTCDDATWARLEGNGQIAFRYCDADGRVTPESNPNGARGNVAGLLNSSGNVLGMMPHPERMSEAILGGVDGRFIFESMLG
jgi:phosphoribosylformylglycinamidine synthase subunit PurQ / glutaminase